MVKIGGKDTFMKLQARKINRTRFLDSLRDALIKKMDEQDQIPGTFL